MRYLRARVSALGLAAGLTIGLACGLMAGTGPPAAAAPAPIDTARRASVVEAYRTRFAPLLTVPTGWTGDLARCKAGTISARSAAATVDAVNFARELAGLRPVRLDAAKSHKAQAAALIMAANGFLTHQPPKSAKCWTRAGYEGASHGNLSLGWGSDGTPGVDPLSAATGPRAVVGYLTDPGGSNVIVGHRRWLLYQQLSTIGTGDTFTANSIHVIDGYRPPAGRVWVSWPTAGYFPIELEPAGRWSLSYPGADFSRATVTVTTPDGRVRTRKLPIANGYGDNTIAWQMALPAGYLASAGPTWTMTIDGVTTVVDPSGRPIAPVAVPDYPVRVTVSRIRVGGRYVTRSWVTTLVQASAPKPVPPPDPDPVPVPDPVPDPVSEAQ